jgi:hypothetical protein
MSALQAVRSLVEALLFTEIDTRKTHEKLFDLYQRAGTPGEKQAAAHALRRMGYDPEAPPKAPPKGAPEPPKGPPPRPPSASFTTGPEASAPGKGSLGLYKDLLTSKGYIPTYHSTGDFSIFRHKEGDSVTLNHSKTRSRVVSYGGKMAQTPPEKFIFTWRHEDGPNKKFGNTVKDLHDHLTNLGR